MSFSYQSNPQEINNEFTIINREISILNKTGTVRAYTGATPPEGWLFCDGSAPSRTTYANLFAVIGTTYGAGDGSTTFNLPNTAFFNYTASTSVYGNGKTMGFWNGTSTVGLCAINSFGGNWTFMPRYDMYNTNAGTASGGVITNQNNSTYELTPDANCSGISGTTYLSQSVRAIIKY